MKAPHLTVNAFGNTTVHRRQVGYGDLVPTSKNSRFWTMLWAAFGVCLIAVALVEVAGMILDARDALSAKTKAALLKTAGGAKKGSAAALEAADAEVAALLARQRDKAEARRRTQAAEPAEDLASTARRAWDRLFELFPVLDTLVYLVAYMVGTGLVFGAVEGWTVVDGMYFATVTGTSTGYGDLAPATVLGRHLALLYLPFAVVFTSTHLAAIPEKFLGGTSGDAKLEKLMNADLSLEGLLAMDSDGDGEVRVCTRVCECARRQQGGGRGGACLRRVGGEGWGCEEGDPVISVHT